MRLLNRLGLVAVFLVLTAGWAKATIDQTLQMQLGNPSGATADPNNQTHYLIQRPQYALDYNNANGEPNWVSWDLTSGDVGGSGRSNDFEPDPLIATIPNFYAVTTADYNGVGNIDFNRGHMSPSEDRTDNLTDNLAVFYMSNIVPQSADNNQGPWEIFENYCRSQASSGFEVLITSGPSGFNGSLLPSGKAAIPAFTWKIATFVPLGSGTAVSRINTAGAAAIRVVAIKIPNINGIKSNPWQNYITTVAQISADTGLTFFTALNPTVASGLQNKPADGQTNTGLPTISVQPVGQSAPVGGSATFSVTATDGGNPPLSYQWFKNDTTMISGATSASLTLSNVQAGDIADYSVTITNTLGSITSSSASLVVTGLPATIAAAPTAVTANAGSNVSFTVTAGGSAPFTYQWQKNGTNLPNGGNVTGATTATLSLVNVQASDVASYAVVVNNAANAPITSTGASLTVNPAGPTITTQPFGTTAPPTGSASFTVVATGTAPLSYQWSKAGTPLVDNANVSGSATATLTLSNLQLSDAVNYTVTVSNGIGSPVTSNPATLAVSSTSVAYWNMTLPTPAGLPSDVTGGTIASGNGNGVISAGTFTPTSASTTSGTVGYPTASGGNNAGVAANVGAFDPTKSAYFEFTLTPATGKQLSISQISFGSRSTGTGPQAYGIYTSANNFAAPIATGTLSTASTPWVFNQPSFAAVNGAPSAAVTVRIYAYNGAGNPSASTANWRIDDLSVTLSTAAATPAVINTSPAASATGVAPTLPISVTFNAPVTVSNGWFSIVSTANGTVSTSVNTTDQTTYTFTPPANFADNDTITVTLFAGLITDKATGQLHPASNTTFSFTTAAAQAPQIVQSPQSQTVSAGSSVTFSVSATGTAPFAYQWRKGGTPLVDGNGIAGSASASLTLTNVQAGSNGSYDVVVSNGVLPTATSTAATLTVNPAAPSITTAPVAVTSRDGNNATFTVQATGTAPFTYQWQKNGNNLVDGGEISGSQTATLTITGLTAGDTGSYTVTVSNGVGSPSTTTGVALTVFVGEVNYSGGTYTQNFDSLPSAGTYTFTGNGPILLDDPTGVNASGLTGWSFSRYSGTGTAALFKVDTGTGTSGSVYSYGSASASDRALGSLASGSTVSRFGVTLVNNTGNTINQFAVTYTGEQWRNGGSTSTNTLSFEYSLGATDINTGTFTAATQLDFIAPILNGTAAPLDGNAPANRVAGITSTITGLNWAPGQTLVLRWSDHDDVGTDDGIAIDDLSFVAVNPPVITTAPVPLTVISGDNATFTVAASSTEALSYQWRRNGTPITGNATATSAQLVIAPARVANAGSYDCVITNLGGTVTTTPVTLTVNKATATVSLTNLTQTYTGSPLMATVTTAPSGLTVIVTYSGASSQTAVGSYVTFANVSDTDYVGTASGNFVIQAPATPPVVAPTISLPPASYTGVVGTGITLNVGASGGGTLTYQWFKNNTAIAGATNATLSLGGAATDSGSYTVAVTNSNGTITSGAATVNFTNSTTTTATLPVITAQPSAVSAQVGTAVTFSVVATGTPAPNYQWKKDGVAIAGATSASYTLGTVQASDAAGYTVTVTNSAGSVTSSLATLTVSTSAAAPVITRQPSSSTLAAGLNLTLTVVATGSPTPTYQWSKDGAALSGATSSTLTLSSLTAAQAGAYTVVVTNSAGSVKSNPATVTVLAKSYAGFYFGSLSNGGTFAIQIFADNTGVFLGFAPGANTAYVSRAVSVDSTGHFSFSTTVTTSGSAASGALLSGLHPESITADVSSTTTFSGTIGSDGTLTGSGNGVTLTASKSASGATSAVAGFYEADAAGSSASTLAIVSPSGQAFVVTQNGSTVDGGTTTVDASGNASLTTAAGSKVSIAVSSSTSQLTDTTTTSSGATTTYSGLAGNTTSTAAGQRVLNVSSRALVTPTASAFAGFVISGVESKPVLIRAVGPTLSGLGVPNPLAAPKLDLFNSAGVNIGSNTGWRTGSNAALVNSITAASVSSGAFPLGSAADSALLVTLAPGSYTAVLSSSDGSSGIALVEVYDLSGASPDQKLVNISTRANAGSGVNALIAGVVVSGTAPQRVIVRAVGPTLSVFGVPNLLAHPLLTLYSGLTVVAANTGWSTSADAALLPDAFAQTGAFAFPTGSADSALLINLAPGSYTAQVTGADGGSGTALVEVYQVP